MRTWGVLLGVVLAAAPAAHASVAAYRTDAELVAHSQRVVRARVVASTVETTQDGALRTRTRLAVLEDFTGGAAPELTVYEPGGRRPDGSGMWVAGAPSFLAGEDVVLCLEATGDGYRTVAMSFSAFRVSAPGSVGASLTRFEGVSAVGGPASDLPSRTLDEFRRTVAAVKGTASRLVLSAAEADRRVRVAGAAAVTAAFTLLEFGRRWVQVDQGQPVRVYRNLLMPSPVQNAETDDLIRLALEAWTAPPSARIVMSYGGTSFDRGPSTNHYCTNVNEGVGQITFGDPGDLLPTGIVSSSGGCYGTSGHVYNGRSYGQFTHAFTVINGTDVIGPYVGTQVMTAILQHELGHQLGLGHSCFAGDPCTDKAFNIMYPSFVPGVLPRPPALGPDDLAGLTLLYGQPECSFTVAPATITIGPAGGGGTITVTPSAPSCGWDAAAGFSDASRPWLRVTEGGRGVGPGSFRYVVDNSFRFLNPRTAHLQVTGADVVITQTGDTDADADGLSDAWEVFAGLDPTSAAGVNGRDGDADGDGVGNFDEWYNGTHPRGTTVRYLAEGAQNEFFDLEIALFNPGDTPASVWLVPEPEGGLVGNAGAEFAHSVLVPPRTRRTVSNVRGWELLGSFATHIESNAPIVVDRTMRWNHTGYGAHAETAVDAPATTWYLAEGSTAGDFALFYLLYNPSPTAATATVRFLRPAPAPPIDRSYALAPRARLTIPVDSLGPELASTDVSGVVTATQPIIVERAMYLSRPNQPFAAGHESAGVTAPATQWFLAEGATGTFFDLFVLIANPDTAAASVTVDYLLPGGGTRSKVYTVAPESRFTIWVDDEQLPAGSGQRPLASTSVSMRVTSTNGVPIIVERAMWWPQPVWYEAHNAPGTTTTGTRWALAAGEAGGHDQAETYVLIANTSASSGTARVTLCFEDGTTATRDVPLPPESRTNVPIAASFTEAAGRRFATLVESVGSSPVPIVVERAMYWSPFGVTWAAGTAAVATRLTP